jgi:hypothetical protein
MANDFAVSISQIQAHSSDAEKTRVWEQLRTQALLRFETSASGTSDGAGTWLTLWSGTCPTNASFAVRAQIVGRGTSEGAVYESSAGVQDFAGVASLIGGGYTLTVALEDAAAMNTRWTLTGSELALQVRDDAVQAMRWKAFITVVGTT